MAFNVSFYSFSKKQNSTKRPTADAVLTAECLIKDETSIISPVLELVLGASQTPYNWNYCYIANFDRYYYIDDWSYNRGAWSARCSVDALASWRTSLKNHTLYVTRIADADLFDTDIADSRYPFKATITESVSSLETIPSSASDGYFVASVAGLTIGTSGRAAFVVFNGVSNLAGFCCYLEYLAAAAVLDTRSWSDFINEVKWYPPGITPPMGDSFDYVSITGRVHPSGDIPASAEFTGHVLSTSPYKSATSALPVPAHPDQSRGHWLNSSIGTSMYLCHALIGEVPIDVTTLYKAGAGQVTLRIDFSTGAGLLALSYGGSTSSPGAPHTVIPVDYGVPVQIKGMQSRPAKAALAVATGAVDVALGNYMGIGNSILNAVNAMVPQAIVSGTNGTRVAFNTNMRCIIAYKRLTAEDFENEGRPCNKNITLANVNCYVECAGVDELSMPCTPAEMRTIKEELTRGVYLE